MPHVQTSITDDTRIRRLRPLLPPAILLESHPLDESAAAFVARSRAEVASVVARQSDRLLVVVGPCSIHDVSAGLEYARFLMNLRERWDDALMVVMRVYFEKPRTTVGWKGLINDPRLDGTFRINEGLTMAREFLVQLAGMGMAAGSEFLDTISPQFIADTVAWGAIGARTTESQVHRELASGLSMPVGFKNGTDGSVKVAIDAVTAARHPHCFLSVTKEGLAAIVETHGNPDTHVILRGASSGPNFDEASVARTCTLLQDAGLPASVMVDCSHGNSAKDHRKQVEVASDVARRIAAGEDRITGVMLESNLVEGRQAPGPRETLVYGCSITDACISLDTTVQVLDGLANAIRTRRTFTGATEAGAQP